MNNTIVLAMHNNAIPNGLSHDTKLLERADVSLLLPSKLVPSNQIQVSLKPTGRGRGGGKGMDKVNPFSTAFAYERGEITFQRG